MNKQNMIYALHDGELLHVDDVDSGLKCNCICPSCGGALIARKGLKTAHHFAHKSTVECQYGYQTSLHLAAKEIISQYQYLYVPDLYLTLRGNGRRILLQKSQRVEVGKVILEKKIGDIIPDILLESSMGSVLVEIYVTHSIDDEKKKKIKQLDIPTIEIDLSKIDRLLSKEALETALIDGLEFKSWIYNGLRENTYKNLLKYATPKEVVMEKWALHVHDCPLSARRWKGISYANFSDDCHECDFYLNVRKVDEKEYMWCSGAEYVRDVTDLERPYPERRDGYFHEKISRGICPQCKCDLKIVVTASGRERFYCQNKYCTFIYEYDDNW